MGRSRDHVRKSAGDLAAGFGGFQEGVDLISGVAPMPPEGPNGGEATFVGPAGHGARIHVEESGHLTGGK